MPLNIEAKLDTTLYASSLDCRYTLHVNLGSMPPKPLGTSSSEYCAIEYSVHLSIIDSSIIFPKPYLLLDIIS